MHLNLHRTPTTFLLLEFPSEHNVYGGGRLQWIMAFWLQEPLFTEMATEIFVPKEKLRRRPQVKLRMSIESPLDEPVHWVTEVKQGKHSLFDQNFCRLMDLLLELSESFLVEISLNKNSKSIQQEIPLLLFDHSRNLIRIPHCPLLISGPDGLHSVKHLLGWFSQHPLQT